MKHGSRINAVALPGEAEKGGDGDSYPPPIPGPGEGDNGDIVEINFLSGLRAEAEWRADAKTLRHMLTHLPKNPHCPHCQRAKMENEMSNFAAKVVLLRMTWQASGTLPLLTLWC